jgi:predicted heme/steroid binding protein
VRSSSPKAKPKKAGIGLLSILSGLVFSIVIFFAASFLITGSWTWGHKSKYTNIRTYIPHRQILLSEEELKKFDGTDPSLPIYIAINSEIYDVTSGRNYYGPGGGYHFFAGVDSARAYITGCFETHLTNDLRGLSEEQLKSLDTWQDFYRHHHSYFRAGTVMHAPIDEDSPLPEPCDGNQIPSD